MKRKFISALLFGAVIATSTGTFVSCKDYDDDITELRNQIASNATDLASLKDEKISEMEKQIAKLDAQAKELDAAYKSADEALKAAIAKAQSDAVDAAKAYADIQAEQARVAAIEDARKMVEEARNGLQAGIDAANAKIAEQGNSIASLTAAVGKLEAATIAAQARADEAYNLANEAKSMAQQNASDIAGLNAKLTTISESMAEVKTQLEGQLTLLNGQVAGLLATAEQQAASISSLETQLKSLKESNDKALAELSGKDAELQKLIEDNNKAINDRLTKEVADLKKQAEDNLKAAMDYTDVLSVQVAGQISDINTNISNVEKAYKAADEQLQKNIDKVKDDLEKQIKDLKDAQSGVDQAQDKRIKDLEDLLNALEGGDIKAFAEKVGKMDTAITTLQNQVKEINDNLIFEAKRLKGLVFAPTTFVDGIECIKFATLQYRDWGSNLEADAAPINNKTYVIDDAEHTEQYLVNPKNASLSDITKLEFVSNNATNSTRAVAAQAPIAVTEMPTSIVNGVMTLKLKKTTTESFGMDRNKFTIVALKATLSDKFVKEGEEKAEVYSDWARLYESSVTPYIHNTTAKDNAGKLLEEGKALRNIVIPATDGGSSTEQEDYSHFWKYSTVYNNSGKGTELDRTYNYRHIAAKVYYKDNIDLYSLVEVCDKEGNVYDLGKYGLGFEFNLMDYKLKNENLTADATNQKHFAKLTDGHILTSTARNGATENRDAIGKEPMIQVVLADTSDAAHKKVVDVRYFKIQWVDKDVVDNYGPLADQFTKPYPCDALVDGLVVLEEDVNAIYTKYNMTRSEFHNSYSLNTSLFKTYEEAAAATSPVSALGSINDAADWSDPGQTHNLKWTINTTDNHATQAEYEKGEKTITAYGYFQSKTNPNSRIVFSLSLKLIIPQMGYAEGMGKDQTLWKNGARTVNPQLYSDATYGNKSYQNTMILGSLLKGYIKDGKTPGAISDLVNDITETSMFVFDGSPEKIDGLVNAVNAAHGVSTTALNWTISEDGLTLYYKGTAAATLDADGNIQLKESNNGKPGSTPTEGAKLLVGVYAPVKLAGSWCKFNDDIDAYNVNFLTPLKLTSSFKEVSVKDITSGGSSSAALAGTIEIKEAFVSNPKVVWNNASSQTKDATRIPWYGVKDPVYDVTKATTNIQKDGTIDNSKKQVLLSEIQNADGTPKYKVTVTDHATGKAKVNFHNLSGNAIGQEFKITIPVTIETKWQTLNATLVVKVQPNI